MIGGAYLAGLAVLVAFMVASGAKLGAVLTLFIVAWIVWSWIDEIRPRP